MKKINLALLALVAFGCTAQKKLPKDEWIQMFNGKDLKDWTIKIKDHPINENFGNTFRVENGVMKVKGITDIHHIHVWALSTTVNAMTAHLIISENLSSADEQELKEKVKHELLHLNIQHATLETERGKGHCEDHKCD